MGSGLRAPLHPAGDVVRACVDSAPLARHPHRRGQRRRPGSARQRPRRVLSRRITKGAVDPAARPRAAASSAIVLAGRLAARRLSPDARTSTATARTISPSRRSAGARSGASPSSRTSRRRPRGRSFAPHTIDPRTGSIDVVPVDLNRDGKMDFVTLLAQEHETIVAYHQPRADFAFEPEGDLRRAASRTGARPASSSTTSTRTEISTCCSPTAIRSTTAS